MIFFPSQAFCYGDYYYDYYYQNTLSVCRILCVSNRRLSNVSGNERRCYVKYIYV